MARRELAAGLVLIALGLWLAVLTAALPARSLPDTPGPAFFPWVIVVLLGVLATALAIRGVRGLRAAKSGDGVHPGGLRRHHLIGLAWFAVFLAVLPVVGFVVGAIPFFAGLMVLYGSRRAVPILLGSVVVPVALFLLFRGVFLIPLPRATITLFGS